MTHNKIIIIISIIVIIIDITPKIIPIGVLDMVQQCVFLHESIRDGVIGMVAAVIGMIPEGLYLLASVALVVSTMRLAKQKVLLHDMKCIETLARVDVLCVDKTGTITNGTPVVTDVISSQGAAEEHLLEIAAALEAKSEHPLSRAVLSFAENRNIRHETVTDFNVVPGRGLSAKLNSNMIYGGNPAYITDFVKIDDELKEQGRLLSGLGRTPLYFAENDHLLGLIAVADTLKEEAPSAIRQLRDMGIQVIMLTGDNKRTAEAIGNEAGVDEVIADVMPDEKEKVIQRLQRTGTVTMVGDGINDAPALTRADTGIAIGAGVDVAIDAADIVLVKSRVTDVPATIRLSRAVIRNIHENLFWAFFYNIICIPLAIGLYQILFHWDFEMKPVIGALAMSFSSVTVCLNALRLNLFRLYDPSHDKKSLRRKKEAYMKKTIRINGMMCEHCEMSVKKALEAINGVVSAEVSHKSGTAEVELKEDVDNSILKSAVEAKDYEVIGIE